MKRVLLWIGVIVVIGVIAIGYRYWSGAASTAKAGDCVAQPGTNEIKVVDCDDKDAKYKVTGKVEDKTQAEANTSCDNYPTATNVYWEGSGDKGFVLCLEPVTK